MNRLLALPVVVLAAAAGCGDNRGASPDGQAAPTDTGSGRAADGATPYVCTKPAAGAATASVATTSGVVRGATAGALTTYFDVPFAAPPIGALRFAAPAAPTCAQAPIDATQLGPECAQLGSDGSVQGVEDCLQLNIWAPTAAAAPRPVMVYLHGGANVVGSATDPLFDGTAMATAGDTIVITINYRLGQLGFISLPALEAEGTASGNFGLLDQAAALRWVQDNVAAFGGDPTNVTIFGESAGGIDVCALVASPIGAGLFARAIIESGGCAGSPMKSVADATGAAWAAAAGCGSGDIASCIRALPVATAIQTNAPDPSVLVSSSYAPTIDGVIQPAEPLLTIAKGAHNHVELVFGSNADETAKAAPAVPDEATYETLVKTQFGTTNGPKVLAQYPAASYATPRDAYVAVTTDSRFVCPTRVYAQAALHGQTEAVYRYFFAYSPNAIGAFHGIELPYVFDTFASIGSGFTPSPTDVAVSMAVQSRWLAFARTGTPGGTPAWPAYDANDTTLELDATPSVQAGIRTAACNFWQTLEGAP